MTSDGPVHLSEGAFFAIPLMDGVVSVGLLARVPRRRTVLAGYFFGDVWRDVPVAGELPEYRPDHAIFVCRFDPDALVARRWPLIARASEWCRDDWPLPEFHRPFSYELTGESWALKYSDDRLDRPISQRRIPHEEESGYPPDDLFPATHLEHRLRGLLGIADPAEEARDQSVTTEGVQHFLVLPADAVSEARHKLANLGFEDVQVLKEQEGSVDLGVFQAGEVAALKASTTETEAQLASLAESLGGRYDGLEWALGSLQ